MLLVLSKLLVLPFYPLGAVFTLSLLGLLFSFLRRQRRALIFFVSAVVVLFLFSLPSVSYFLIRGLETRYRQTMDFGPAPAVVLLGGYMESRQPPRFFDETNCNADRMIHAARVFKLSGSERLIVTGGRIEFMDNAEEPEAAASFRLLSEFAGIDRKAFILEGESRTTRENALFVKRVMEEAGMQKDIHLVTSAYHMPRSVAIFEKLGFRVRPAPTDYRETDKMNCKPYALLPNVISLYKSTVALHEYYGIITYKLLGWL
ncbi:MAG: YdcF family protein [Chitinispirillaceae bacterium]